MGVDRWDKIHQYNNRICGIKTRSEFGKLKFVRSLHLTYQARGSV